MKALYAGSFDPFTIGHENIVIRSLKIFEEVVIAIGENEGKKSLWSVEDRVKYISERFEDFKNVKVCAYKGLTVDFAKKIGAGILVRGARSGLDFEVEKNLAEINKEISGMETCILVTDPSLAYVSSSMVKELLANGRDPGQYLGAPFPISLK